MPGRWPPLEARVLDAAAGGLPRAALAARLETMPGNEWIVDEAVEDLLASGALREEEGPDGAPALRAA